MQLQFEPEALEAMAQKAIDRKIGARGLRAVLEDLMIPHHVRDPLRPGRRARCDHKALRGGGLRAGYLPQGRQGIGAGRARGRRIKKHSKGRTRLGPMPPFCPSDHLQKKGVRMNDV